MDYLQPVTVRVPNGMARLALQVFEEDGRVICGIYHLEGHLFLRPKAWLRTMRAEMTRIEGLAKNAGCEELRLCGRDWSRIFPDYEPLGGLKNGLRKVL